MSSLLFDMQFLRQSCKMKDEIIDACLYFLLKVKFTHNTVLEILRSSQPWALKFKN